MEHVETPWKENGIYLLKNEGVVSVRDYKGNVYPIKWKVKNIRPILYFCTVKHPYSNQTRVDLRLINPISQFTDKTTHAPNYRIYIDYYTNGTVYYGNLNNQPFGSDDFIFLGEERSIKPDYWGGFTTSVDKVMKKWEEVATLQGHFTPRINPDYKSKKERALLTHKDFFGQDVKVGDWVAYTILSSYQRIHTGFVFNITDKSFVIKQGKGPGFYVAPHNFVIKCPEGYEPERKD